MVELGREFWKRHLLFRDYLRTHPDEARKYAQLKRELAQRFRYQREGYTNAKSDFIRLAEATARAERPTTGA